MTPEDQATGRHWLGICRRALHRTDPDLRGVDEHARTTAALERATRTTNDDERSVA